MATRSLLGPASYDVAAPVRTAEHGLLLVQLTEPTTRYRARKAQAQLVTRYPGAVVRVLRTVGARG